MNSNMCANQIIRVYINTYNMTKSLQYLMYVQYPYRRQLHRASKQCNANVSANACRQPVPKMQ